MQKILPENPQKTTLSNYSADEKPWSKHRATADTVETIYGQASDKKMQKYATRISACSQVLEYAWNIDRDGSFRIKFKRAQYCRVRHCAVCQWRRSMKWKARFLQAAPEIGVQYPTARWVFLTLTVPNCKAEALKDTVRHMAKSFERLSKQKAWPAFGWIRTLEVTRADDGWCHPHYHVLLMVRPGYFGGSQYLSKDDFAAMWQKALRLDRKPVVDVRAVRSRDGESPIAVAASETLKYAVKVDEKIVEDPEWLIEVTKQLHKVRGVTVGGVLRDLMRSDEPEPDEPEDEPEFAAEGEKYFTYSRDDKEYLENPDGVWLMDMHKPKNRP